MAKSIREIIFLKIQNAENDILFEYSSDFGSIDLNYMISLSKSIVTDDDEFLGTITIQVCSLALKKIFTEFTKELLFISLIGVFISGIIVWAALSVIFAPLKLVELNLDNVLNNPKELPERQNDEIGLVVHSFNKLAMEVRKTYMGKGNESKDP
jgi:methyl-accepting chemotaxis protein